MKKIKILSFAILIVMTALCVFGCAPKLSEDVAVVAIDYYSYVIMRQDNVSVNDSCAYDKIAATEAVYTKWAEESGKSLEEYLVSLAETRNMPDDVNTTEEFLKAQSDIYVEKNKTTLGEGYFSKTPEIVSFSDADNDEISSFYNDLMKRYGKDLVDFSQYLKYEDIEEGKFVTVGIDDNNVEVLIVKIGDQWKYLA